MIAAVYCRKSTEQNVADEQKSVARQVEHARSYAARKGWTVNDDLVFVDDGISGAEFTNRPGFLRLMNSLKPRAPFQVLIMSEESRLGREAIETSYALKQIIVAGVRVFFYLEDRERTLDSPTDKIMLSLQTFADEIERERGRLRTYDAMQRKARAGHVCGGRTFGYENVEIVGPDGRRSHVERRVVETEAAIVQRIFALSAEGHGFKAIAKRLNDERAPSPRAQRGRSQSWAPSSVREVLFRDAYRGVTIWNKTKKRNGWGVIASRPRPASEWVEVAAPDLRIVTDGIWSAAHGRLDAARRLYLGATKGRAFGRPVVGSVSRYLLTNLAACGCCDGALRVRTRNDNGRGRLSFYGCAGYHERGRAVCRNNADVPMPAADAALIDALLSNVLDRDVLRDAVEEAVALLMGAGQHDQLQAIEADIATTDKERQHLVAAIAAGGQLAGLLDALQGREATLTALDAKRKAIASQTRLRKADAGRVRAGLHALAGDWRRVLADDPEHARPIVVKLLQGRVTFTPMAEPRRWQMTGTANLRGFFEETVFPVGLASPPGIEPGSRP